MRQIRGIQLLRLATMGWLCGALACGAQNGCGQNDTGGKAVAREIESVTGDEIAKQPVSNDFVLVDIGRAIELGRLDLARKLLEKAPPDREAVRYLQALLAKKRGDAQKVVTSLEGFSPSQGVLMKAGMWLRLDALIALGRFEEALSTVEKLDVMMGQASRSEQRRLDGARGQALLGLKRFDEAAAAFSEAARWSGPKQAARWQLKQAAAMLEGKTPREGQAELVALALNAPSGDVMVAAKERLDKAGINPGWGEALKRQRIDHLMDQKAYTAAIDEIAALLPLVGRAMVEELTFVRAKALYLCRRQNKAALEAFSKIVSGHGRFATEAFFWLAKTLSRLNRDEEAIAAYLAYGDRVKVKSKAARARFLAGRLLFYLGDYQRSVTLLEKLVGRRRGVKNSGLSAGDTRDGHFFAGMGALAAGDHQRAVYHFEQGMVGTASDGVRWRNRYWRAVALLHQSKEAGREALVALCEQDPTNWYALMGAIRLDQAQLKTGPCILLPEKETVASSAGTKPILTGTLATQMALVPTLERVSGEASLWASMGLFRRAAIALNAARKRNSKLLDQEMWATLFNRLDAPHLAIRQVAVGLVWPPSPDDAWRWRSAYPTPYSGLVTERAKALGLPDKLVLAIARKESLFDPMAVSTVGAMGMMQMMPHTYEVNRKRAGLAPLVKGELPDAAQSIKAGSAELAFLLNHYNGSLPLAVMAYNAGVAAVNRWLERSGNQPIDWFVEQSGYAQTRNYVRRVTQTLLRYRLLYGDVLPPLPRMATRIVYAPPEKDHH